MRDVRRNNERRGHGTGEGATSVAGQRRREIRIQHDMSSHDVKGREASTMKTTSHQCMRLWHTRQCRRTVDGRTRPTACHDVLGFTVT